MPKMFKKALVVTAVAAAVMAGSVVAPATAFAAPAVKPAPVAVAGYPSTSPAVYNYLSAYSFDGCPNGHACMNVPYGAGAWVHFEFYYYGTYRVSYWYGSNVVWNNQTGSAALRFLNSSGGQILCVPARATRWVDFYPVYYVRLTSNGC